MFNFLQKSDTALTLWWVVVWMGLCISRKRTKIKQNQCPLFLYFTLHHIPSHPPPPTHRHKQHPLQAPTCKLIKYTHTHAHQPCRFSRNQIWNTLLCSKQGCILWLYVAIAPRVKLTWKKKSIYLYSKS